MFRFVQLSLKKAGFGIASLLLLTFVSFPLFAQTSIGTSTLGGTVLDASDAGIGRAKVTLTDELHGTSRTATANSAGEFQFPGILPGIYSVTFEANGFNKSSTEHVRVAVDQRATVNAHLNPGSVAQVVEVSDQGATPLLETSSNALGGVIENKQVEELPLNGRNFLQLALLEGATQAAPAGNQTNHPANTLQVAGGSQWLTGYNINGISTRSPRLGNSSLNISVAAIDQFKIELGFFLPDKGPQVGIVDVVTKAGTNKFHGEIYDFIRNRDFDAKPYGFGASTSLDDLHRNQYGIAVGGPVIVPGLYHGTNRLWFFANYEAVRQTDKSVQNITVPTAAMFGGDFSGTGITIYNPYSYNATTKMRAAFTDDKIPSGMINPVAKALLNYYLPGSVFPLPKGTTFNLTGYPVSTFSDDQGTLRIDAQLTEKQSVYASTTYETSPVITGNMLPLRGTADPLSAALGALQHTYVFNPHLINIARIGYNRAYTLDQAIGVGGPPVETQIGITGTTNPQGVPNTTITGFTGLGNAHGPVGEVSNAYQFNDGLSWVHGTHNVSMGLGLTYHRTLQANANAGAIGTLGFQNVFTTQTPGGTAGGSAFADFLLGLPLSGSASGFKALHYRFTEYYPYIQDSWRATPSLTLNYGMGWYYSSVPNPQGPDAYYSHGFDMSTGLITYAALGQISAQVIHADYNNFMPRVGLVLAPRSMPQTTVRAGFGVYYGQLGLNDIQGAAIAPPFTTANTFSNSKTANLPPNSLGNAVFPVFTLPPLSSATATTLPAGLSVDVLDPNSRTPYLMQWNLSVQQTLGPNNLIEVDYIGNSGHKFSNRYELDQCPYDPSLFCNNALKPYPNYGSVYSINYSTNANYAGMIVKYRHQVSQGLTVLANYTYQRAMSNGFEPNSSVSNPKQITGCGSCDYGPSTYDTPHAIVVSTVYDLPFGRGRRFGDKWNAPLDAVAGGWRISFIGQMLHGTPVDVTAPSQTGSVNNRARANQLCNGNDRSISRNLRTNGYVYFKQSCYATPATGYFGNSGKGAVYTPGTDNWDLSAVKSFNLPEHLRFEVRGEAFNVFNHTNFGNPDTNTGDIASGTFGTVSSASSPRLIQIAGKLVW